MGDFSQSAEQESGWRDWPHAPPHRLEESGVYFVTARCLEQEEHFRAEERRDFLLEELTRLAERYGWVLEAWAVMSNHYHFVAHSTEPKTLRRFLTHLHGDAARYVNRLDGEEGRKVWHNFRDTHLTYELSYLARLNYVHQNAVHHGIVPVASQYRWCSAREFEAAVSPAFVKVISRMKYDEIAREDGE